MAKYVAEATASRFHADRDSKVKLLMSAVGQGKTVACIQEMIMIGIEQDPDAHGVRKTRWAVIRSTFGQLKTTTIQTFKEWVPHSLAPVIYDSPIRATIDNYPLDDGTFLHIEFWFMPLDSPEAYANLLGAELTGAYVNELPELRNQGIVQDVYRRTGRYPAAKDGAICNWSGVIADYNPPPRGSWLHRATETDPIPGWTLYRIPPPIQVVRDADDPDNMDKVSFVQNPDAENVQHQPKGIDYWIDMAENDKKSDWEKVRRFALGDYPNGVAGRAVFSLFSHSHHTGKGLQQQRGSALFIGLDLGLCYDDETEVLTRDGFKYFKDVTMQDEMATRNPESGAMEYHKPKFLVDEQHDGDMIVWENTSINMCVTPEHRVPMTFRDTPNKVHFKNAEWIEQRPGGHHYVDLCAEYDGVEPAEIKGLDPDWFAWFMGVFLSDGSVTRESRNSYRVQITQTKAENVEILSERLGPNWTYQGNQFRTTDKEIGAWLYGLGSTKEQRSIPPEIMRLSRRLLLIFLEGMTLGDGSVRDRPGQGQEHTICTAHEHIARQLQEIALKVGWNASCTEQDQRGKAPTLSDGREIVSNCIMRTITFKKRAKRAELQAAKCYRKHYTGRRYCVNVTYHTLYVRRGGRCHWNGNTPAAAFMQFIDGTVQQTDEITTRDASLTELIEDDLIPLIRSRYMGFKIVVVGDPTGGGRSQYDKTTPYRLFAKYGIKYVVPKGKNEFVVRRDATNKYLKRLNGYKLDEERCPDTLTAFLGGYQWDDSRGGVSLDKPKKSGEEGWFSHIMDAVMGVLVYFEQGADVYAEDLEHHDNLSSWTSAHPSNPNVKRNDDGYFYA